MAEMDEYRPKDWTSIEIEEGSYLLQTEVKKCTFFNTNSDKPYMQLVHIVLKGDKDCGIAGFEFDDRVYIHKKAEWRAQYFLRKFDYPAEFLEQKPPRLIKAKIEGLQGKVLLEVSKDNFGMLKTEIKKFDHINGDDIEKELQKKAAAQEELPLAPSNDAEPTKEIDVNADLSAEDTTDLREALPAEEPAAEPEIDPTLLD